MHQNQEYNYQIQSTQTDVHASLVPIVQKHLTHPWQQPIASHTEAAFTKFLPKLDGRREALWLDSGCGTGMSTIVLARANPDKLVIGVDKSQYRLSKLADEQPGNCLFVRAELADFLRLCQREALQFEQHTLFYPNPWPKPSQLKRRWQGHPIFPTMLALATKTLCRSNWRIYCEEFALAARCVDDKLQVEVCDSCIKTPISLFEKKYIENNISVYECCIVESMI